MQLGPLLLLGKAGLGGEVAQVLAAGGDLAHRGQVRAPRRPVRDPRRPDLRQPDPQAEDGGTRQAPAGAACGGREFKRLVGECEFLGVSSVRSVS